MRYSRVIWDFNGTLLDDVAVCIHSADTLLARYSLPPIATVERYHEVFGFPVIDYYRRVGFDFDRLDFKTVADEWVALYLDEVERAPLRAGISKTVREITRRGLPQTVLSMTEQKMLLHQLDLVGMREAFDEVVGLDNVYASSKLALAAAWREEHPGEHPLYIGDTLHDAESAGIIGADCLLLTGGHESASSLASSGLPLLTSPQEILAYLEE